MSILKKIFFSSSFAGKIKNDRHTYPFQIILEYPLLHIKTNNDYNKKLSRLIEEITIKPNQIFSFWKVIGKTREEEKNEYSENTNMLISSLLYHISLLGNLSVLERHSYSHDYFTDENRIFPLGADACVIYKSKDLKIKNTYSFPIKFKIEYADDSIKGYLVSSKEITRTKVLFKRKDYTKYKQVFTRINSRTVEVSMYKNQQ